MLPLIQYLKREINLRTWGKTFSRLSLRNSKKNKMLTPLALDYLNSISFAQARVDELHKYHRDLFTRLKQGDITFDRFEELEFSCWGLYAWWLNHLTALVDEKQTERLSDSDRHE